jgi:hypothetical protein
MKTLKYIIVPVLTGLLFVACNNEPKGPTQAELDTQVEAKVKAATDQLKADCDSRIMQAAQSQADSLLASAKPVAKPVTPTPPKTRTTTKTTTVPAPPPVKVDPKKDKMGGGSATKEQNLQDKKDKMQGKETQKEDNLDKKKSKMGGK